MNLPYFQKYLEDTGDTDEKIAVAFGVTSRAVVNWRKGDALPQAYILLRRPGALVALAKDGEEMARRAASVTTEESAAA